MEQHLGGFQHAAHKLTEVSGRSYSRQAVQGLWERRAKSGNGFPELHVFYINGRRHLYFDLGEVAYWYNLRHAKDHHAG
jgi:hypothetical protein